jgi:hypothetical protein
MATYLEGEEATLASMAGLSEEEFLTVTFDGSLVAYKNFALDRADLRRRRVKAIRPVILSDDDWRVMRRLDIPVAAWLRSKYDEKRQEIQGLKDLEVAERRLKQWADLNLRPR